MNIGEICIREVIIIERDDSITEAAQLMRKYHVGDVLVVKRVAGQAIPVGILTDRDIVIELVAQDVEIPKVTVGDTMSFELVTVHEDDDVFDVARKMMSKGVRRLPVVNDDGGLVGIVSADDMIELFTTNLVKFSRVFERSLALEVEKLD